MLQIQKKNKNWDEEEDEDGSERGENRLAVEIS